MRLLSFDWNQLKLYSLRTSFLVTHACTCTYIHYVHVHIFIMYMYIYSLCTCTYIHYVHTLGGPVVPDVYMRVAQCPGLMADTLPLNWSSVTSC